MLNILKIPTIKQLIYTLITLGISLFILNISCYAELLIEKEHIELPCQESAEKASWVLLGESNNPKVQYTIIAKGIRVKGIQGLITYPVKDHLSLPPTCLNSEDVMGIINQNPLIMVMCTSELADSINELWPPEASFTCPKGAAIIIKMYDPTDQDPDKFHFVGELIKTTEKDEDRLGNKVETNIESNLEPRRGVFPKIKTPFFKILQTSGHRCIIQ